MAMAVLASGLTTGAFGQWEAGERLLSFEGDSVPPYVSATLQSEVALSASHYKDGRTSLRWTYRPGAELVFRHDLPYEANDPTGKDTYMSAFSAWIYNEKAVDDSLRVCFLKDGRIAADFATGHDPAAISARYLATFAEETGASS